MLTLMFFLSGIDKLLHFSQTVDRLKIFKFPIQVSNLLIMIAICIELIAPIFIVYSIVYKQKMVGVYSCVSLIVFTIFATLMFHFPPTKRNYYPFMSNLSTIGGLGLLTYVFYKGCLLL